MTAFLPAVFGALIVIGLIGMVYALIPAPPKPPRPARTVTPLGRAGGWFSRLAPRTRMLIVGGANEVVVDWLHRDERRDLDAIARDFVSLFTAMIRGFASE